MNTRKPIAKRRQCSYCADAQINHFFSFLGNFFGTPFDDHVSRTAHRAPKFLKNFVDWLSVSLLQVLAFLKIAKFSGNIEKVKTFRSRVIWEEAKRRGIKMEQVILFGRPLDYYRALRSPARPAGELGEVGRAHWIYFESLPIPPESLDMRRNWDDKFILKGEFDKGGIPVPRHLKFPLFYSQKNLEEIFSKLEKPVIVKPKVGSRGRHTITNINSLQKFREGIAIVRQISPYLVVEEHLLGDVCRATLVNGMLAGFYRGQTPSVVGDGKSTIGELIKEKDKNRPERVEKIRVGEELYGHLARSGYQIGDILPEGKSITLSYHFGRLFGGTTREMIDELHPSFFPIFEKAAQTVDLAVVGFDSIIPDPTEPANGQKWGIIECNTLPFIDLHYDALEGKPRNIAGMIWDLWN